MKVKAVEAIYKETYDKTLLYIIMKCGKVHEVEDILQEIYMELFQVLMEKGIGYIKNPRDFVMHLAKSKVYQFYSKREREEACVFMEDFDILERENLVGSKNTNCNAEWEDALVNRLTAQEAMKYIAEKDELTKEIFYQHYFEDKTLKEIAARCGVKEATVKNRLYRTLKELSGLKKLAYILVIVLLAALLAKPVCLLAEDMISKLKKILTKEDSISMIDLGSAYRTYRTLIDEGVLLEDINININGKDYTIDDLEQVWISNPWLEELEWENNIISGDSTEESIKDYDIYLNGIEEEGNETKEEKIEVKPTGFP